MEARTLYRHIHGFRKTKDGKVQRMPLMTVASHMRPIGSAANNTDIIVFGIGIAVCSSLDMPNRKIGRQIAGGRAESAPAKGADLPQITTIKGNPVYLIEDQDIPFLEELKKTGMMDFTLDFDGEVHSITDLKFYKWSPRSEHIPAKTRDFLFDKEDVVLQKT